MPSLRHGRWRAQSQVGGSRRSLGYFTSREEAAAREAEEREKIETERRPTKAQGGHTSQFRGVTVLRATSRRTGQERIVFLARIRPPACGTMHLGTFTVEDHGSVESAERAAALAYDAKARELFGDDAVTNFSAVGARNSEVGHKVIKFRGVCWDKRDGRYQVKIRAPGAKETFLGLHPTAEAAARVYDAAALRLHGNRAVLNFAASAASAAASEASEAASDDDAPAVTDDEAAPEPPAAAETRSSGAADSTSDAPTTDDSASGGDDGDDGESTDTDADADAFDATNARCAITPSSSTSAAEAVSSRTSRRSRAAPDDPASPSAKRPRFASGLDGGADSGGGAGAGGGGGGQYALLGMLAESALWLSQQSQQQQCDGSDETLSPRSQRVAAGAAASSS